MVENTSDKIFKAIADPKRREILKMLVSEQEELNINFISDKFTESRQAITKHLKILEWASLIKIEKKGRGTFCSANPEGLVLVDQWLDEYRKYWMSIPGAIDDYLSEL